MKVCTFYTFWNKYIIVKVSDTKGFSSEEDLLNYYEKHGTNKSIMAVIFNGISENIIPQQLNYDIRLYQKAIVWHTNRLFVFSDQYIPLQGGS